MQDNVQQVFLLCFRSAQVRIVRQTSWIRIRMEDADPDPGGKKPRN